MNKERQFGDLRKERRPETATGIYWVRVCDGCMERNHAGRMQRCCRRETARIGSEPSLSAAGTLLPGHNPYLVYHLPPEKAGPSWVASLSMPPFYQLYHWELLRHLWFMFSLYFFIQFICKSCFPFPSLIFSLFHLSIFLYCHRWTTVTGHFPWGASSSLTSSL